MLKSETVIVPQEWGGRDAGKCFLITEFPAVRAEKWAWRLFIAVKGTSAAVPDEVARLGMVGVAIRGLNAFLAADVDFRIIEPLLDEMMECLKRIRDVGHPDVATKLIEGDIEEIRTVTWLRSEVIRVHTGFSFADSLSTLLSMMQRMSAESETT